jgi:RNA polymerase sigma-70 factor (ECF subfamily)
VDEREDASAVDRWLQGATGGIAAVVERYQQPLGAYLFHLVGDLDLALAITQETFIRCRAGLTRSPTEGGLRVTLYRVGTGLALNRVGAEHANPRAPRESARGAPRSGIVPELRSAERGLAQAALRDLTVGERAVLLLCDLEQFSTSEAAAILGVSGETLCWRLVRARARFRLAYVDACAAHGDEIWPHGVG